MLEPKEVDIPIEHGVDGEVIKTKTFVISKFPAIAGREIIAKYPISAMPKLGDYSVNEETMLKLMAFVSAKTAGGDLIPLTTAALVDNHVPDWEALGRIEIEMMGYNCSFFQNGKISGFFDNIKVTAKQLISSTLTDSLGQLLRAEKQR